MKITIRMGVRLIIYGLILDAILVLLGSPHTVFQTAAAGLKECFACTIVDTILTTMSTAVTSVYQSVTGGLLPLLLALYTIWLAVYVIKHVGAFKSQSIAEFYTGIMKKSFLVLFIGFLVASSSGMQVVFNLVIIPLVEGFVNFGNAIVGTASGVPGCSSAALKPTISVSGLDMSGLVVAIKCLIGAIHQVIYPGIAIGAKLLSSATAGFWVEFIGLILFIIFVILDLLFPLQIFDSLFRLALVLILLPVAIMLSAFQVSRKYLVKLIEYFAAILIHISVISIVFAVCVVVVSEVIPGINSDYSTGGAGISDENQLKNIASLQMKEVAMFGLLVYMIYILNQFNEYVGMLAGVGVGSSMAEGAKNNTMKSGLGVGALSAGVVRGLHGVAKNIRSKSN